MKNGQKNVYTDIYSLSRTLNHDVASVVTNSISRIFLFGRGHILPVCLKRDLPESSSSNCHSPSSCQCLRFVNLSVLIYLILTSTLTQLHHVDSFTLKDDALPSPKTRSHGGIRKESHHSRPDFGRKRNRSESILQ